MDISFCTTELLYRATDDGWGSNTYHSKVDEKGSIICIFKSSNDNVFGGYTKIGGF
jgi:hypothetical protein